jgi:hypothetical protein
MPWMIIPPPAPNEVRWLLIVHPRLPSSQFHPVNLGRRKCYD